MFTKEKILTNFISISWCVSPIFTIAFLSFTGDIKILYECSFLYSLYYVNSFLSNIFAPYKSSLTIIYFYYYCIEHRVTLIRTQAFLLFCFQYLSLFILFPVKPFLFCHIICLILSLRFTQTWKSSSLILILKFDNY